MKNHHRTNAVVISSAYLFLPLLLVTPNLGDERHTPLMREPNPHALLEPEAMRELIGRGGPEERPQSDYLDLNFGDEDAPTEPKVVYTKTYNYMKVANTRFPVDTHEVSSDFGWRRAPCSGCSSNHQGIDFVPGAGKPVYAITDGMVVEMGSGGGYGFYVIVTHLVANVDGEIEEWTSLYAHMQTDSFPEDLRIGSAVKMGDELGRVGSTGMSTGAHLHFELRVNGEIIDPMPLLGTYEVVVLTEEEHEDWLFLGETFKTIETVVTYE